jgi:hypothetical protein
MLEMVFILISNFAINIYFSTFWFSVATELMLSIISFSTFSFLNNLKLEHL